MTECYRGTTENDKQPLCAQYSGNCAVGGKFRRVLACQVQLDSLQLQHFGPRETTLYSCHQKGLLSMKYHFGHFARTFYYYFLTF